MKTNTLNCKVIMLPTEKWSNNQIYLGADYNYHVSKKKLDSSYGNPQHLYLVSTREIKEGDWCLDMMTDLKTHNLTPQIFKAELGDEDDKDFKKIEATTNPELVLPMYTEQYGTTVERHFNHHIPQINSQFVEAYVKANGTITEVCIEMEEYND